ncbi:MAG: tetratricopeptide repeat protein, partial [Planctomycetota bacterium]
MDEFVEALKKAKTFLTFGEPDRAFLEAQKAIQLNPNNREGYLLAGKAKFELGEYASAILFIETAQQYGPLDSVSEKLLSKAQSMKESKALKKTPEAPLTSRRN